MSREGGYLTDIPWDTMPVGSYTAEEMTPPEGYTKSPDQHKVKQTFVWDGKSDVSLIFENDAKVKVRLVKLDDSNNPLPGAVFNIVKDGQIVGTEETKADGSITVTDVTEGMYRRGSGFLGGWRIQQWHIHRAPHGCRGIGRRFGGGVCQIFRRKQRFRLFCPCFRRRAGLFPLFAGVCAPYCRTADVLPFRGAGAVKSGIRRALADALFLAGGTVVFHQTVPSHLLNLFLPCPRSHD